MPYWYFTALPDLITTQPQSGYRWWSSSWVHSGTCGRAFRGADNTNTWQPHCILSIAPAGQLAGKATELPGSAGHILYTLGIALGLHFLWVGHFPVTFSYVYLLAIMFKGHLACLRWEFLTAHGHQFINVVDIWRQKLQLWALYQWHLLLSALTTYFGQTVHPTGSVSHITFLFCFNYRVLHTWKNYQMLQMSGIFLNC